MRQTLEERRKETLLLTLDCLRCVAAGKPPAVEVEVEVEALLETPVLRRSTTSPTSSKGCC